MTCYVKAGLADQTNWLIDWSVDRLILIYFIRKEMENAMY